jgi:AcrR family transcriptional regulator
VEAAVDGAGAALPREGGGRRSTIKRRAAIREAAIKIFAENGYGSGSLREVATAAELQKGHLSYYFPSKEHLLYEVILDMHERFVMGMPQWLQDAKPSASARLQHVLTEHAAIACNRQEQTLVSYENFRFLSAAHHAEIILMRHGYERDLRRLIEETKPNQGLGRAPSSLLVKTVLGIVNWPYQWFRADGSLSAEEVSAALAQFAMQALRLTPLADPRRPTTRKPPVVK